MSLRASYVSMRFSTELVGALLLRAVRGDVEITKVFIKELNVDNGEDGLILLP